MVFTNEQVTTAIRKVVAGKEDYVYDATRNTPHKEALGVGYSYEDCIVGCVMRELNPALHDRVLEWEKEHTSSFPFTVNSTIYPVGTDDFTREQAYALREAQIRQDGGARWGEALSKYNRSMGVEA